MIPADADRFVALVIQVASPVPGKLISPAVWCAAFLAHAVKWPPVVDYLAELLATDPLTGPADMVRVCRQCVHFADGKSWPKMFSRMNAGGFLHMHFYCFLISIGRAC